MYEVSRVLKKDFEVLKCNDVEVLTKDIEVLKCKEDIEVLTKDIDSLWYVKKTLKSWQKSLIVFEM